MSTCALQTPETLLRVHIEPLINHLKAAPKPKGFIKALVKTSKALTALLVSNGLHQVPKGRHYTAIAAQWAVLAPLFKQLHEPSVPVVGQAPSPPTQGAPHALVLGAHDAQQQRHEEQQQMLPAVLQQQEQRQQQQLPSAASESMKQQEHAAVCVYIHCGECCATSGAPSATPAPPPQLPVPAVQLHPMQAPAGSSNPQPMLIAAAPHVAPHVAPVPQRTPMAHAAMPHGRAAGASGRTAVPVCKVVEIDMDDSDDDDEEDVICTAVIIRDKCTATVPR